MARPISAPYSSCRLRIESGDPSKPDRFASTTRGRFPLAALIARAAFLDDEVEALVLEALEVRGEDVDRLLGLARRGLGGGEPQAVLQVVCVKGIVPGIEPDEALSRGQPERARLVLLNAYDLIARQAAAAGGEVRERTGRSIEEVEPPPAGAGAGAPGGCGRVNEEGAE